MMFGSRLRLTLDQVNRRTNANERSISNVCLRMSKMGYRRGKARPVATIQTAITARRLPHLRDERSFFRTKSEIQRTDRGGAGEMRVQLVGVQQAGWPPPIAAIVATSRLHSFLPSPYFSGISMAHCTRTRKLNNTDCWRANMECIYINVLYDIQMHTLRCICESLTREWSPNCFYTEKQFYSLTNISLTCS